jgi:hypothetical protein
VKKYAIIAAVIVAAGIAAYFLFKRRPRNSQFLLNNSKVDEGKTTLNASQRAQAADSLHVALKDFGTDFSTVLRIFASLKNQNDLNALIQAYGIREHHTALFWYENFNLIEALSDDLSEGQKKELTTLLKNRSISINL